MDVLSKMDELGIKYVKNDDEQVIAEREGKKTILGSYSIDTSGVSEENLQVFYQWVEEQQPEWEKRNAFL